MHFLLTNKIKTSFSQASFFIIHRAHPRAKRMARWMMKNEAIEFKENSPTKSTQLASS